MSTTLDYPIWWPFASPISHVRVMAIAFEVGTGGQETVDYYALRGFKGYTFPIELRTVWSDNNNSSLVRTPMEDLSLIRKVLRPAVTDLAFTMGVSRQAVYDWQNGKQIAVENAARLADLARAADVIEEEGLTASPQLLRRPIVAGKTLFELVREGGSAEDAAKNLADRVRREMEQRQMLAVRLVNRKRRGSLEGYGAPALDEQA